MSKKDYVRLAAAMAEAKARIQAEPCGIGGAFNKCLDELVRALAADNGRFDAQRFIAACGGMFDN